MRPKTLVIGFCSLVFACFVVFSSLPETLPSSSISAWIRQTKHLVSCRHHHDDDDTCHSKKQRSTTLKLIREAAFSGLFDDLKGQLKFEASGVACAGSCKKEEKYFAVFDSSMSLGYMDASFSFRGVGNKLIGEKGLEDSQYEGIAYVPENDTFLLLQESLPIEREGETLYKPHTITAKIRKDQSGYDIIDHCKVDFELTHENKGFEAIAYTRDENGTPLLLGMCEGNHCQGGKVGRDAGNGKIIVSKLTFVSGSCVWEPIEEIQVPKEANFIDYSDMAINEEINKIAILSQENSAVFIGDFDVHKREFLSESGIVFHLPRDNHCNMIYCNAEGIQWLDDYRLLIVSDKAKSKQPYWCDQKDQSVHIFSFPPFWDPAKPLSRLKGSMSEEVILDLESEF